MEEMETEGLTPHQIYHPGDVVWVKISGMWWPAEVKDQSTLDPEITEGLKKQPLAVVQFLKEDTYEHIKSLDHIYHYVCKRKEEFLKLGFKKYFKLKNEKNMALYPESIQEAERRTGGDPEIIHNLRILPQEVQEQSKIENGGRSSLPANFKAKKGSVPRRSAPAQSGDGDVTGDSDNETVVRPVKLEKQGLSWYPYPQHITYISSVRRPPRDDLPPPVLHRCSMCCFETTNFEILMLHHKYNQHNTTLIQPSKYHWRNPLNRSEKRTKSGSGIKKTVVRKKKDSIKPLEKRIRKKKKDLPPVPAGDFTPPKKSKLSSPLGTPSALEVSQECAKIIEEWTDDEDENKTNDATYGDDIDCSASTNVNTMEVTAEIKEPSKDSEKHQNIQGVTPTKMDKPPAPPKTASCFDFDDDEPAEPDLQSLKFGQKLPRVITPEKSKPPDPLGEGDNIDDLLKEVSVPEIPLLPPTKQDSLYSRGDRTYGSSPFKDAKKSAATSPEKAVSDADANVASENNKNEEKHFLAEGPLQSKKRKSSGRTEGAEDGSAFNKKLKKGVSPKKPSNEEVGIAEVANKESSNIAAKCRAAEQAKQSLIDTLTYSPKPEEKTIEDENVLRSNTDQIGNDNSTPDQGPDNHMPIHSNIEVEDKCQTPKKAETPTALVIAEGKSPISEPIETPKSDLQPAQSVRSRKSRRRKSQLGANNAAEELPLEVEIPPQIQQPQKQSSDKSRVQVEKHELPELSDVPPPDPDKVGARFLDIVSKEVPQEECFISPSSMSKNKKIKSVSPASSLTNQTLNEKSLENQVGESPREVFQQSKSQAISSRKSHRDKNQLPQPAHEDVSGCQEMSKTEIAGLVSPLGVPTKSPTASSRRRKRGKIDDSQGIPEQVKPPETPEPRKSEMFVTTTNSIVQGSSADEPELLKSPSTPSRRSSRNKSLNSEETVEPIKSPKNKNIADEVIRAINDPEFKPSPTSVTSKRKKSMPHESAESSSLLEDDTKKKEAAPASPELNEHDKFSKRSVRAKLTKEALHVDEIVEPKEVVERKHNQDAAESKVSNDSIGEKVADVLASPKVFDAVKSPKVIDSVKSPPKSGRKSERSKPESATQGKVDQGKLAERVVADRITEESKAHEDTPELLKSPSLPSRRSRNKSLHSEETVEPIKSPKNKIPAGEVIGAITDPDIKPSPTSVKSKRKKSMPHESTESSSLLESGTKKEEAFPASSELNEHDKSSRRSMRAKLTKEALHVDEIIEPKVVVDRKHNLDAAESKVSNDSIGEKVADVLTSPTVFDAVESPNVIDSVKPPPKSGRKSERSKPGSATRGKVDQEKLAEGVVEDRITVESKAHEDTPELLKSPSLPSRRSRNKSLHSEETVEPIKSPENKIAADEVIGAINDPDIKPLTSVKSKRKKSMPHESTESSSLLEDGTKKKGAAPASPELSEHDKSSRRSIRAKLTKEALHADEIIEPKEVVDRKHNQDAAVSKVSNDLVGEKFADVLASPKVFDAVESPHVIDSVKSPPKSGRKSERSKPGSATQGKVDQGKLAERVVEDRITEESKAHEDTPELLKSPSLPSRRSTRSKSAHSEEIVEPINSPQANEVPESLVADANAVQSTSKSIRTSKWKKSTGQEHIEVPSLPKVETPKREASPEVQERARSSRKNKKFKSSKGTACLRDVEPDDPTSCIEPSPPKQLGSCKNNKSVSDFGEEAKLLDHTQDINDSVKTPEKKHKSDVVSQVNSHVDNLPALGCIPTETMPSEKLTDSKLLPPEESNSVEPPSVDQAPKTENFKDLYESPRRSKRNQSSRTPEINPVGVTEPEIDHAKVAAEVPKGSPDPPLTTFLIESSVLNLPSKNATLLEMPVEIEVLREVEPSNISVIVPQEQAEYVGAKSVDETAKVSSSKDMPELAKDLISPAELGKDSPAADIAKSIKTNKSEAQHISAESETINVISVPGDNADSSLEVSDSNKPTTMSSENESVHLEIASLQKPEVASNDTNVSKELEEKSAKSELALTTDIVPDPSLKVKKDNVGDKSTTELPSTDSLAETPSPFVGESETSKSDQQEEKSHKSSHPKKEILKKLDKKKKESHPSSHTSAREPQGSKKWEDKLKRSSRDERFRESSSSSREASSKKRGGERYGEMRGEEASNLKQEKSRIESKSSSKEKDRKDSKENEISSSKERYHHRRSSRKELSSVDMKPVEEKTDRSSHRRSSRKSTSSSQASDATVETSEKPNAYLDIKASKEMIGKSETNGSKTSRRPSEVDPFVAITKTPENQEKVSPKKPRDLPKRNSFGASKLTSKIQETTFNEEVRIEKEEALGRSVDENNDSLSSAREDEISKLHKSPPLVTCGVVSNLEHSSKLSSDASKDALWIQSEDLPSTESAPKDLESKESVSSAANANENSPASLNPLEKDVFGSIKNEIFDGQAPSPQNEIVHSPLKTFRHDEAASLLEELLGSSPKSSPASSPKKSKADSPVKQESPRRSGHSKDIGDKFLLSPSKVLDFGSPTKVVESSLDNTQLTPSRSPKSVFPDLSATPVRASRWDSPYRAVKSPTRSLATSPTKTPRSPGSKLKVEILSGSRVKSSPPEKTVASDAVPQVPSLEQDSSHQSDDELSALQAEILSYSALDKTSATAVPDGKKDDLQLAEEPGSVQNSSLSPLNTSAAMSPSKKISVKSESLISPVKSVGCLRAHLPSKPANLPATPSGLSEAAELANILKGDVETITQESITLGPPDTPSTGDLSNPPAAVNVVDGPFQGNVQAEGFGSELFDIISMPIIFANDEDTLLPSADPAETEAVSSTAPVVPVISNITLPSTDGPPSAVKSTPRSVAATGEVENTSIAAPEPVHSTSTPPEPKPGDVPEQELIETEIIMDHSETELQSFETAAQTQEPSGHLNQYPSWLRPDFHEFLTKGAVEKKVYRAKRVKQMVIGIYDQYHPDYSYYMSLPPCTVGTSNFKESWADVAPEITKPTPKPHTMLSSSKMSLASPAKPAGINSIKLVTSNSNQLKSATARKALSVDKSKSIVTVARPETVGAEVVLASSPAKNSPVRIVSTQSFQLPFNIIRQQPGGSPSRPASSRVKQDVLTSLEKLKAGQLDPQMKTKLVGLANNPEVLAKLTQKNMSPTSTDVKVAPKNVIVSTANIPIMKSSPAKSILIPTTSTSQPKNLLVAAHGVSQPKNKVVVAGNQDIKFTIQPSFKNLQLGSSPKFVVTSSPGEKQPIVIGRNFIPKTSQSPASPGPSTIKMTQALPQRPLIVQGLKGKPPPNLAQKAQTIQFRKVPAQVQPVRTVQRPAKQETFAYVPLANNMVIPGSDKTVYVVSGTKPAPTVAPGSDILAEALGGIGILPSDSEPFTEEPSPDLFNPASVVIAGSLGADQLSNISFEADR